MVQNREGKHIIIVITNSRLFACTRSIKTPSVCNMEPISEQIWAENTVKASNSPRWAECEWIEINGARDILIWKFSDVACRLVMVNYYYCYYGPQGSLQPKRKSTTKWNGVEALYIMHSQLLPHLWKLLIISARTLPCSWPTGSIVVYWP